MARHVLGPARLLLSSCVACDRRGGEERRRAAAREHEQCRQDLLDLGEWDEELRRS